MSGHGRQATPIFAPEAPRFLQAGRRCCGAKSYAIDLQRVIPTRIYVVGCGRGKHEHRPHTAVGERPPADKLQAGVTNLMASYS